MLEEARLDEWLERYATAWETKDADAVVELFTPTALYHQTPFEEPFDGRAGIHDYWVGVTTDQKDIRVTCERLTVYSNTGIAHWHARFSSISSRQKVELDGVFVLQFDAGLCCELREWWHAG